MNFKPLLLVGLIGAAQADTAVQSWLTTADQSKLLAKQADQSFSDKAAASPLVIEVDASKRYQTMEGFGASITDASAELIQKRMKPAQRTALLKELFGREGNGVGFDFTRLTIGASDFSSRHYTFSDMPKGKTDMKLKGFSIAPNRADVLPVVKAAVAINPGLNVMASPWSAPAWMKTNDHLYKGHLNPKMYGVFSEYMMRYVDAYAAEGVNIFALTIQNEPNFEPDNYPGMRVDPAERAELIGKHLGPLIEKQGKKVKILDWDHNWDHAEMPMAVLADPDARKHIAGVAWHCYEGDVSAQTPVRDAYPDKEVWFTECSGGEWAPKWNETLPWMMKHLVVGSVRHWAKGVLVWNLALDEKYGPHKGGCGDCRGVVTINSKTGAVTRNIEYYALAHASKFVRRGAVRIESNSGIGGLDTVAFRNSDDGSTVLIVSNSADGVRNFSVRQGAQTVEQTLPASGVVTLVWK